MRDITFVAANMRPVDDEEIMSQMPDSMTRTQVGAALLQGDAYVAFVRGRPTLAFGVAPMNVVALSVWAFGTEGMWRAVPAVTRFLQRDVIPRYIDDGYRIMEARGLATNNLARNWMLGTGATIAGDAFEFGKGGKKFLLYRWTADGFAGITRASAGVLKQEAEK